MKRLFRHTLLAAAAVLVLAGCEDENDYRASFDRYEVDEVTALSGDESVTLQWKPQEGKPTPVDYYITWTTSQAGENGEIFVDGKESSAVISPLVNDCAYTFAVQARYESGLARKITASCTPKSTRLPVTDFKAMAGDGRAFISWVAPATELSYSYSLTVTSADGAAVSAGNPEPDAVSYLVNGLENGKEYTFALTCVYGHGNSPVVSATAVPGEISPISALPETPHQYELCKLEYNPAYFISGEVVSVKWSVNGTDISSEPSTDCYFALAGSNTVTVHVVYDNLLTESASITVDVLPFAWTQVAGTGYQKSSNIVFARDGQTFYTVSQSTKTLFAVDAVAGTVKWQFATAAATYGAGPAVGPDGKIYFGTEDGAGTFYAITPNGIEKWKVSLGNAVKAAPAVTSDGVVYVLVDGGKLTALDAETGSKKWDAVQSGNAGGVVVDADGNVYIGTSAGLWSYTASGSLRWRCDAGHKVTERGGSLALHNGVLYATLKSKGGVAAVDMNTGRTLWTSPSATNDCYHPVVDTDGTVYFCEKSGGLYAVDRNGAQKWHYTAEENYIYSGFALGADDKAYISEYASPFNLLAIDRAGNAEAILNIGKQTMSAVSIGPDCRVYYGLNGSVAAFDIKTPLAAGGWPMRGGNHFGTNSLK